MHEEHGVEVHAFCLMGNHYHLIVRCEPATLERAMGYLGQVYTQQFNAAHQLDGPLFRGRFGSVPITSDEQLLTTVRYVALNPLDLGVRLSRYPWSSHRCYLGLRASPTWMSTDVILRLVHDHSGYQALVAEPRPGDPATEPTLAEVERAVLQVTGSTPAALRSTKRGQPNRPRLLAILAAASLTSVTRQEIAEAFGFASPTAVRVALHRARVAAMADTSLADHLVQVEELTHVTVGSVPSVTCVT